MVGQYKTIVNIYMRGKWPMNNYKAEKQDHTFYKEEVKNAKKTSKIVVCFHKIIKKLSDLFKK